MIAKSSHHLSPRIPKSSNSACPSSHPDTAFRNAQARAGELHQEGIGCLGRGISPQGCTVDTSLLVRSPTVPPFPVGIMITAAEAQPMEAPVQAPVQPLCTYAVPCV